MAPQTVAIHMQGRLQCLNNHQASQSCDVQTSQVQLQLTKMCVFALAVGGFQVQFESYSPSWVGQFLNTRALLIAMTVLASAGVLVVGSCFYCSCQRRRGRVSFCKHETWFSLLVCYALENHGLLHISSCNKGPSLNMVQ
jgi:hypothetical protein